MCVCVYIYIYIYMYMEEMATLSRFSCLENLMDKGGWWATVHGVTKMWTQMSDFTHTHTCVCIHVYMYVHVCIYVCVCIYITTTISVLILTYKSQLNWKFFQIL